MNKLFEPYTVGNVTLKNRFVMSPMCMYESDEQGLVHPFHIHHYATRAMGQVGLIMVESTSVLPEGRTTKQDLGLWQDTQKEGLKQIVQDVKYYGSSVGIQLNHAGRKSQSANQIYAPSPIQFNESYLQPTEMSHADIEKVIDAFVDAAIRAKDIGFDVIELHAAHGYLINSFFITTDKS